MSTLESLRLQGLLVYGRILKMHRRLPADFRTVGNAYVRDEFEKHHHPTTPGFTINHYYTFLNCWRQYLTQMQTPEIQLFGKPLQPDDIQAMSRDQRIKLGDVKKVFTGDTV